MEDLTVAAVSTRNHIGEPAKSIKAMAKWTAKAADAGAELVVFPELNVNGYFRHPQTWDVSEPVPGPSTERIVALAGKHQAVICYGILERDADVVYNTQVLVDGQGIIGKQRKIHMPHLEYLYWRGGFAIDTFDIGKARVGITICYDSLFSELARSLYFKGAEVLIMPFAYDTQTPRAQAAEKEITLLTYRAHCYSNGCFGVVCNNAGKRSKSERDPDGMRFPGWAGMFSPLGPIVSFTDTPGNGETMVVSTLYAEDLAARRRNACFMPRCLRPELYVGIDDSDQLAKRK